MPGRLPKQRRCHGPRIRQVGGTRTRSWNDQSPGASMVTRPGFGYGLSGLRKSGELELHRCAPTRPHGTANKPKTHQHHRPGRRLGDRTIDRTRNRIGRDIGQVAIPDVDISQGRYFFMDVARDGIAIYQAVDDELPEPQPKTPHAALEMAREYFEEWFPSAESFVRGFRHAVNDGDLKKAAFDLHQSTERFYHCALLVCTFYTPHVHNLAFLRTNAERIDPRLVDAWPREAKVDRSRFEKLKEAYIKARYSKHYRITEDELRWLGERVEALAAIVRAVCDERIAQLEATARHAS